MENGSEKSKWKKFETSLEFFFGGVIQRGKVILTAETIDWYERLFFRQSIVSENDNMSLLGQNEDNSLETTWVVF